MTKYRKLAETIVKNWHPSGITFDMEGTPCESDEIHFTRSEWDIINTGYAITYKDERGELRRHGVKTNDLITEDHTITDEWELVLPKLFEKSMPAFNEWMHDQDAGRPTEGETK